LLVGIESRYTAGPDKLGLAAVASLLLSLGGTSIEGQNWSVLMENLP